MLHLKIEAYEALNRTHWSLTLRDLDAGPDEQGLVRLRGGVIPETGAAGVTPLWRACSEALDALANEQLSE